MSKLRDAREITDHLVAPPPTRAVSPGGEPTPQLQHSFWTTLVSAADAVLALQIPGRREEVHIDSKDSSSVHSNETEVGASTPRRRPSFDDPVSKSSDVQMPDNEVVYTAIPGAETSPQASGSDNIPHLPFCACHPPNTSWLLTASLQPLPSSLSTPSHPYPLVCEWHPQPPPSSPPIASQDGKLTFTPYTHPTFSPHIRSRWLPILPCNDLAHFPAALYYQTVDTYPGTQFILKILRMPAHQPYTSIFEFPGEVLAGQEEEQEKTVYTKDSEDEREYERLKETIHATEIEWEMPGSLNCLTPEEADAIVKELRVMREEVFDGRVDEVDDEVEGRWEGRSVEEGDWTLVERLAEGGLEGSDILSWVGSVQGSEVDGTAESRYGVPDDTTSSATRSRSGSESERSGGFVISQDSRTLEEVIRDCTHLAEPAGGSSVEYSDDAYFNGGAEYYASMSDVNSRPDGINAPEDSREQDSAFDAESALSSRSKFALDGAVDLSSEEKSCRADISQTVDNKNLFQTATCPWFFKDWDNGKPAVESLSSSELIKEKSHAAGSRTLSFNTGKLPNDDEAAAWFSCSSNCAGHVLDAANSSDSFGADELSNSNTGDLDDWYLNDTSELLAEPCIRCMYHEEELLQEFQELSFQDCCGCLSASESPSDHVAEDELNDEGTAAEGNDEEAKGRENKLRLSPDVVEGSEQDNMPDAKDRDRITKMDLSSAKTAASVPSIPVLVTHTSTPESLEPQLQTALLDDSRILTVQKNDPEMPAVEVLSEEQDEEEAFKEKRILEEPKQEPESEVRKEEPKPETIVAPDILSEHRVKQETPKEKRTLEEPSKEEANSEIPKEEPKLEPLPAAEIVDDGDLLASDAKTDVRGCSGDEVQEGAAGAL